MISATPADTMIVLIRRPPTPANHSLAPQAGAQLAVMAQNRGVDPVVDAIALDARGQAGGHRHPRITRWPVPRRYPHKAGAAVPAPRRLALPGVVSLAAAGAVVTAALSACSSSSGSGPLWH